MKKATKSILKISFIVLYTVVAISCSNRSGLNVMTKYPPPSEWPRIAKGSDSDSIESFSPRALLSSLPNQKDVGYHHDRSYSGQISENSFNNYHSSFESPSYPPSNTDYDSNNSSLFETTRVEQQSLNQGSSEFTKDSDSRPSVSISNNPQSVVSPDLIGGSYLMVNSNSFGNQPTKCNSGNIPDVKAESDVASSPITDPSDDMNEQLNAVFRLDKSKSPCHPGDSKIVSGLTLALQRSNLLKKVPGLLKQQLVAKGLVLASPMDQSDSKMCRSRSPGCLLSGDSRPNGSHLDDQFDSPSYSFNYHFDSSPPPETMVTPGGPPPPEQVIPKYYSNGPRSMSLDSLDGTSWGSTTREGSHSMSDYSDEF